MKWTPTMWVSCILGLILIIGGIWRDFGPKPSLKNEVSVERQYARYATNINHNFEYWYTAKAIRVIDGDTFDAKIDMGLDISIIRRIRMAGINAPEMKDAPRGQNAKQFLEECITDRTLTIKTVSDDVDAYGRLIATVFVQDGQDSVNDEMIKNKQATIY